MKKMRKPSVKQIKGFKVKTGKKVPKTVKTVTVKRRGKLY